MRDGESAEDPPGVTTVRPSVRREVEFLREAAIGLLGFAPERDLYLHIAERFHELAPGCLVAVNEYDAASETARNRAVCGDPERLALVGGLFERPLGEMRLPVYEEARRALLAGRLVRVEGAGLYDFAFRQGDPATCAEVERRLGIRGLYAVGFSTGERLLGNVAIIVPAGGEITDPGLVETFAQLAAVAIESRSAQDALRQVEARYARVAANLPGVTFQFVVRRDGSMAFPFVSRRAVEFSGVEPAEFERDVERMFEVVHPDDWPGLRESIRQAVERTAPWAWVGRFRTAGGEIRWMQGVSRPERTPDGDVLFDGVLIDVTDRKRVEEELERAKAAAEAASQAKTTFLANTSHELRTPLSAVLGMLGLLAETRLDERQRDYVRIARDSGEELLRLIDDLLDLSRIEADRLELERCPFPTREPFAAALRAVELTARDKGLSLSLDLAPDVPPLVVGDASRLRQVVRNVVDNAVKFTPAGGVSVRVSVAAPPKRSGPTPSPASSRSVRLQVEVRDTGIGIAPHLREEVFEPFVQGDASTSRRYGGSGLGLAICHRLVRRMDGRIWIEGPPEGGTAVHFTVTLGRAAATADSPTVRPAAGGRAARRVAGRPAPPRTTRARPPAAAAARPLHVLLVEDHPAGRMFLEQIVRKLGHDVRAVADGRSALAALARATRRPFDAILLDLQLPGLDGYAVLDAIRSSPRPAVRRAQVIAVTAHAGREGERRCLAAGMNGYLRKPVRPESLAAALARAARRRPPCR